MNDEPSRADEVAARVDHLRNQLHRTDANEDEIHAMVDALLAVHADPEPRRMDETTRVVIEQREAIAEAIEAERDQWPDHAHYYFDVSAKIARDHRTT